MTQTETDEEAMRVGLEKVVDLIEQASLSVAKLMASVRVAFACSFLCITNNAVGFGA